MNNRLLLLSAQVISLMFSPFYMPIIGFLVMFLFSYLKLFPWQWKLSMILWVYFYTVLLPTVLIYGYRKVNGWTRYHLGKRNNRLVPYCISILCYGALLYMLEMVHAPHFTRSIIVTAIVVQVVCAVTNRWLKICVHSAASGAVIGGLAAFALIFHFDPLKWLCFATFLSGLVGTARLILRQHSLVDIASGTAVGVVCGFVCVMWL